MGRGSPPDVVVQLLLSFLRDANFQALVQHNKHSLPAAAAPAEPLPSQLVAAFDEYSKELLAGPNNQQ
jgi:hypothetical protein